MKESNTDIFSYLITNKDFRDWVMKPNDERNYFWKEWMDAHPESLSDVKKAREFIERMSFKKAHLSSYEMDDLLGKIIANKAPVVHYKPKQKNINLYTLDQWVKVAAILIIGVIFSAVTHSFINDHQVEPAPIVVEWRKAENPKGRKSKVFLPDGTVVNLNSGSEIEYPKYFSETERQVKLKGEAFFEVTRDEDRPFIIQTERMTTEVLGTSFNIKAHPESDDQYIAVVTGKVKVSNTLGEEEILVSDEMGLISKDNRINKASFDVKQITGWKDGIISFKRASFEEIQERLSMWYGVDFIVKKGFRMANVYTGEFHNETLENVLHGIAFSSGFTYKISDNKVYID